MTRRMTISSMNGIEEIVSDILSVSDLNYLNTTVNRTVCISKINRIAS